MRPLLIANLHEIEGVPLLSAVFYGEDGRLLDEIVCEYESDYEANLRLLETLVVHGFKNAELWTSTPQIHLYALKSGGLATSLKHPKDTADTRRRIDEKRELLMQFYDIKPLETVELPRWIRSVIRFLESLIQKLRGEINHGETR